ncbi:ParM/StbA family protein [Clostridium guangxiense]|uniref:ParM/StbA family protein n=1 Tax=Clostridium guangxiense TaxID=1662055 RepID=UPI001E4BB6E8|nr:ParM/StbA family protein [Clostridium guangxiense]MCD2347240.1 ParM/StbA family protein [Clostridium guangxiense]
MKEILTNIAIDSGKSSTKGIIKIGEKIEKVIFRTKIQEIDDLGVDITKNTYIIEFKGKSYLIGDMVSETSCDFQITKTTIQHKLSIYNTICQFIDKTNALMHGLPNINLAINAPLNVYKNNILKENYKKFIQNNGETVSIKINGTAYAFKINSLLILPEATGPLYIRTDDFRTKKATIVDIGSLNVNFCTFNRLVPELDTMNVANLGINVLRSKIAETLTSIYGVLITDADVEEVFKNNGDLYMCGIKKVESKEIIEKLINKHVTEIFNYARSRGLTFNNTKLVFIGGGSLLLKQYILKQYPLAIIEQDSQFSNCLSFLNILEIKYGN